MRRCKFVVAIGRTAQLVHIEEITSKTVSWLTILTIAVMLLARHLPIRLGGRRDDGYAVRG